ncbi:EscN/YscN/HrcN family type III secretion system ATPase [Alicyclobacillus contaminans]|uniref:FliI/YscN family ATPase n=1 Tax=Alicyclobacillus contaminans TaxID=392016 RepID=UPI0004223753|nr:FliI/YscN family ATPase [Alicyclobacillus contaminans]GMA49038.1 EscN/YscN/HrcN family type III secretion system ATPase [Alicyclobacillus contaminans]
MWLPHWDDALHRVRSVPRYRLYGRVTQVVGTTVESFGPPARLGELCEIHSGEGVSCLAEVVGFRGSHLVLMPLGELSNIGRGAEVLVLRGGLQVPCGDGLLGRVLDGFGQPLDDLGPLTHVSPRPLLGAPPHPLQRPPIRTPLQTGVRAIDAMLPVGEGQRMGIFAGSGVGKSTLLSMIARNTSADVNVIALVGERGREVREFLDDDLGADGLAKSVVVVATSDQPPLLRIKAAFVATTIAEYFRDAGKSVNLMMDSVTRFAMAQREIGLAVGEPPTSRGYTPSVFALLPKLLERAGTAQVGSITAFYTVLVDGDDLNDPIADAVRGILDGHVVLSRSLANAGHFPAIDVLASISRLFHRLADEPQKAAAMRIRDWMQRYRDVEDLLRIGAYQNGLDAETDRAIERQEAIRAFLRQGVSEVVSRDDALRMMADLAGGV